MNLSDILKYAELLSGPLKTVRDLFNKLNPSISITPDGNQTNVLITVDKGYLEINKELEPILTHIKQIKLNNINIELKLRDKVLRLTDAKANTE